MLYDCEYIILETIYTRGMPSEHIAEAHLTVRGQIAIPKKVLEKLNAKKDDYILFFEEGGRIYIEAGHLISRKKEKPELK